MAVTYTADEMAHIRGLFNHPADTTGILTLADHFDESGDPDKAKMAGGLRILASHIKHWESDEYTPDDRTILEARDVFTPFYEQALKAGPLDLQSYPPYSGSLSAPRYGWPYRAL